MITEIKWKDPNILGNLELDFTKEDGTPYSTIIIAGENGTGKTTILDTLADFLGGRGAITPFEYIQYVINSLKFRIFYESDQYNRHRLGFHKRHELNKGEVVLINRNRDNDYNQIVNDQFDVRSYGAIYSRARSGFKTKKITSTTTKQLDEDEANIDYEDDYTNIKQLLIDISSQDNSDLNTLVKTNGSLTSEQYDAYKKNSRMHRFESAFNAFFDNMKYDRIDEQSAEEKTVLFKKYGKSVSIDSLSTGEKQVVFRGSYLLKNQKKIDGGFVLIDEPELSMHPLWQEKILEYYRNLFTVNGKQNVQMIFATHSEYVIKNALEDRENVLVIALKNVDGEIKCHRVVTPTVLPTLTLAETNYNTFNIASNDYHILLYGYLQRLIYGHKIKQCDEYIEEYINNHYPNNGKYKLVRGYNGTVYKTLPTYIRNAIDHPDSGCKYTEKQLKLSTELLIEMIKNHK